MDVLRQWALCVIIAAAAGTLVCVLSPKGATDKAVRTVIGIFVVSTICVPLQWLDSEEITLPAFAESYASENDFTETDDYIISAFKSAIEDEILSVASQYGVEIHSVGIDVSMNNSCIIIHNIQMRIQSGDGIRQSDFAKAAEEKLGAPVTLTQE